MAIFTADELTEQITAWKAALLAVANAQSYSMAGRQLTKADLPEIRSTLRFLNDELNTASGHTGPHITAGRVKR